MFHGSLFAGGVDGFSLAVGALGGRTVWNSEVNDYCARVLALRYPEAEQLGDVRELDAGVPRVDLLSGGFPCQDLSSAGNGAGLDGARSGLWTEFGRVIGLLRPELVMVENVPRLLGLHFERLLRDLYVLVYDCEWDVISAAAVGAPHLRERLWLLAYPSDGATAPPRALGRILRRCPLHIDSDGVKWPRAGAMCAGIVFESEPVAPRKTKRVDGRTYWVGVDLLSDFSWRARPWPSPNARDYKDVGDLACAPVNGLLPRAVQMEARGLWPTPHGMPKDGAVRVQGPSGNELGWAVNRGLFPTPTNGDSRNSRNNTAGRTPGGKHHSGTTLSDLAFNGSLLPTPSAVSYDANQGGAAGRVSPVRHSLELMARQGLLPTPSRADGAGGPGTSPKRHGGKNLRTEVSKRQRGSLNPSWVEWMMAAPVGLTDVDCDEPVYVPFSEEPLPRVVERCPNRRRRLQAIGNSLVWLIPYWILSRYDERVGLPGRPKIDRSVFYE